MGWKQVQSLDVLCGRFPVGGRLGGCALYLGHCRDNVVHIFVVAQKLGLFKPDGALAQVFCDRAGSKGGQICLCRVPRLDLALLFGQGAAEGGHLVQRPVAGRARNALCR